MADMEQAYWHGVDQNSRLAIRAIREFIDYLEGVKKELCLQSTKLLIEDAVEFLGPATEVAVAGLAHAIDYLSVCRRSISETDVVLAKRFLTNLDTK